MNQSTQAVNAATPGFRALDVVRSLRPVQWVKNLLLAVPLLVGHRAQEPQLLAHLAWAVAAFCLASSAVYVANDLMDREADRRHPTKRRRPYASGSLPVWFGIASVLVLTSAALAISALRLPPKFTAALVLYLLLTSGYTFYFKRKLILDAIVLAGLYVHRIIAGGLAVAIFPTPWLLAFSGFLFLSLAFAKRYAELRAMSPTALQTDEAGGRGYQVGDIDLLRVVGPVSGYLAVLVFCLYIKSDDVSLLYRYPVLLWLLVPVFLYYFTRLWFLAQRGAALEDPVFFIITDKAAYACAGITLLVLFLAHPIRPAGY